MPDAYQFFGSNQAIRTSELLATAIDLARGLDNTVVLSQIARVTADFAAQLNVVAAHTAQYADERIRENIRATARRPETDKSIHLVDLIRSEPFLLGSVRIALIDELNKAVDPEYPQSGPYWRAQEYGKDMDEWLFGMFFGGDEPGGSAPLGQYKGGGGPASMFVVGQPGGGWGHFDTPLQARHFLERGTADAAAYYMRQMSALSHSTAGQIDTVIVEVQRLNWLSRRY